METGLKDRVAIVTGASRGIGEACAIALAREGVKVVLAARSTEVLAKVAGEVERLGSGEALPVTATGPVTPGGGDSAAVRGCGHPGEQRGCLPGGQGDSEPADG